MTNDALINGKVVTLSDEERVAAEKFHMTRCLFGWVNGELTIVDDPEDDRDHQHWMLEDYGISPEEFENINRGYMLPFRIQLFVGSDFRPIDLNTISAKDISTLIEFHKTKYRNQIVEIFNGVKVGKVGEIWDPIERIFAVANGIETIDEDITYQCILRRELMSQRSVEVVPNAEAFKSVTVSPE